MNSREPLTPGTDSGQAAPPPEPDGHHAGDPPMARNAEGTSLPTDGEDDEYEPL